MSATIRYRRLDKADPHLPVYAPSHFQDVMEKAFGRFPCEVRESDIPMLRGIAAAAGSDFEQLIPLIEQFGAILVYAEY